MATTTKSLTTSDLLVARESNLRVIGWSVVAGIVLTIIWSFTFVDSIIGDNIANSLLGYDVKETAITGTTMGALFAFVSRIAGTFTACNIAAFSAVAPLMGQEGSRSSRWASALKPVGWLALGTCVVAGLYGAVGALIGTGIPQLSAEVVGNNYPVGLIQSNLVFGAIGVVLVYMGLAAIRVVPDPLARIHAKHPNAQLVIMGGLIGAFLIGRPFPLFFKMFQHAAETGKRVLRCERVCAPATRQHRHHGRPLLGARLRHPGSISEMAGKKPGTPAALHRLGPDRCGYVHLRLLGPASSLHLRLRMVAPDALELAGSSQRGVRDAPVTAR
ncbi:MAG: hypothetical protein ACRDJ2_08010 [Actinomycetota bacterium]